MKSRLYLLSFLIFFLFCNGNIIYGNSIKYKAGIRENDQFIWKCKVCNELELNFIFGVGWNNSRTFQNLSKGSMMKWKVNTIELNETVIKTNFSIWYWTQRRNWGVKDNDSEIIYLKEPTNYPEDLNYTDYSSFVPFWFPTPIGEYMGNLDFNTWYDVDNRVLPTLNVDISKDAIGPGFPNKDIQIIAIYNDQGILSSYKLYTKGNVVIIDISLDFLPFYVIPTLIGLFTILSTGVIYYIIKKLKIIRVSSPK